MAATGRAVRSNSKTTGMNADVEVWQPRDKVGFDFDSDSWFKQYYVFIRPVLDYGDVVWNNCSITRENMITNE